VDTDDAALINTAQMEHYGMTTRLLETVCDTLKTANLIRGEQEFCEQWLAKSECYMRTLRYNNIEPSAEALATLGSKLGYYSNELALRGDDTCAHWSAVLTKLRAQTQAALELRVRQRWQSVCAQKTKQREKSL
jgi:hypothetical protein